MNTRIWVSVTLFIAVLLGGCGKDTAERPAAAEAEVGVTTEFEWLAVFGTTEINSRQFRRSGR